MLASLEMLCHLQSFVATSLAQFWVYTSHDEWQRWFRHPSWIPSAPEVVAFFVAQNPDQWLEAETRAQKSFRRQLFLLILPKQNLKKWAKKESPVFTVIYIPHVDFMLDMLVLKIHETRPVSSSWEHRRGPSGLAPPNRHRWWEVPPPGPSGGFE